MDPSDLLHESSSDGEDDGEVDYPLKRVSATIRKYKMLQPRYPSRPGTMSIFDEEMDPIIKWEIVCGGLPGRGDWSLWVTYEDFAELDKSLRKRHKTSPENPISFFKKKFGKDKKGGAAPQDPPPRKVPEFAPRAWLRDDLSPDFLAERAHALQQYLDQVLALFPDDPSLEKFLMPLPEEDQRVAESQRSRVPVPVYQQHQHQHQRQHQHQHQHLQHQHQHQHQRQRFGVPGGAGLQIPQVVGEVWLAALLDGVSQSLAFISAVHDKFTAHGDVAAKLQILEENAERLRSSVQMMQQGVGPLRQASGDPVLPAPLAPYLATTLQAIQTASEWVQGAEAAALASLGVPDSVSPSQDPTAETSDPVYSSASSSSGRHVNELEGEEEQQEEQHEEEDVMTIKGSTAAANAMVVGAVTVRGEHQVKALQEQKRRFLKGMQRALAKSGSPGDQRDWRTLIEFVETNVVPSVNVQDLASALETRFYALVARRAALEGGDDRGASGLMGALRDLRRTLQMFKAELLKEQGESGAEAEFIESIVNSVTDLQENACNLEFELETNYRLDNDVEDVVINKVIEKKVSERRRQAQRAQDDLFSL